MATPESRQSWIRAAFERLAESGVEAVRVEPLARALGVTKGSFYWHFDNRRALLDAMLADWEQTRTLEVIDAIEALGGSPAERLRQLSTLTQELFDSRQELGLREWARRDAAAAEVVQRVDDQRMGYLRALLREIGFQPLDAEGRALALYSVLIGSRLIGASHDPYSRQDVVDATFYLLTDLGGSPDGAAQPAQAAPRPKA